jgi:hypothetical protein
VRSLTNRNGQRPNIGRHVLSCPVPPGVDAVPGLA